jgi:hypothetical protein
MQTSLVMAIAWTLILASTGSMQRIDMMGLDRILAKTRIDAIGF